MNVLNSAFYKRFWSLCGGKVTVACRQWLEEGNFPHVLIGDTNIILFPKFDQPKTMKY